MAGGFDEKQLMLSSSGNWTSLMTLRPSVLRVDTELLMV